MQKNDCDVCAINETGLNGSGMLGAIQGGFRRGEGQRIICLC